MKSTGRLLGFVLILLALAASTFAQEANLREQLAAANAALKKAEAALAQAKSAEASAIALGDKEALPIARQAVALAEKTLSRARSKAAAVAAAIKEADRKFLNRPVPDLTDDPVAVRLSNLRLREVEGRIRRLQLAIDILGSSNPEWDKEWDRVYQDMRRDSGQLSWVALELLTLDLVELNKLAKGADIAKAGRVLEHELWNKVPLQHQQFRRLLKTADAAESRILQNCIAQIDQMEKAHQAKQVAEALGPLREMLVLLHELHEKHPPERSDQGKEEAALEANLVFGQLAIVFVKGVGEKANVAGTLVAKGVEAELLFTMILQEQKQHRVLASASYNRHQKKLELMERQTELEEERSRLLYARDRSLPKVDK